MQLYTSLYPYYRYALSDEMNHFTAITHTRRRLNAIVVEMTSPNRASGRFVRCYCVIKKTDHLWRHNRRDNGAMPVRGATKPA